MLRRTFVILGALVLVAPMAFGASIAADLQKTWSQQEAMLMAAVGAMPEESFDFKPTEAQRTFGEQALHVAGGNTFLLGFTGAQAKGLDITLGDFATFGIEASTKAEILAALEKSFDHGGAALSEFDDEAMLEEVQGPPWLGKITRATMFGFIVGHQWDIYGQMVVYLRLQGVTPPASARGGNAR